MSLELRAHLFAFALITICMEAWLLTGGSAALSDSAAALGPDASELSRGAAALSRGATFPRVPFALTVMLLFFFYCLLEHTFSLVARRKAASFFPLLPAALLLLLLQKTDAPLFWSAAVASAAAARLFFILVPHREKVLLYGVFAPDAAAAYLYFGGHVLRGAYATDKLLFVALAVLTLASLQELLFESPLLRSSGTAFPFFYFALLGILVAVLPMRQAPINWTPVAEAGGCVLHRVMDIADSAAYYLSSKWSGSYTTGYHSLEVTGGKIERSDRTELILRTGQEPYHMYTDEETSGDMKMRRTLYLAGGMGVDKPQLIRFLRFLRAGGADREYAALFSQVSEVEVEYAYLNTADEIAPVNAFLISDGSENGAGAGSEKRKGYRLTARYLDIDYGSPYLSGLIREAGETGQNESFSYGNAGDTGQDGSFTYEDACDYFMELYGVELGSILTREEFEEASGDGFRAADLDTEGADDRLQELADELAGGVAGEYDKCRMIEGYLRQYSYQTDAAGGHDPHSTMSTSAGMADIAGRFLFETGAGYCVHYTASMVMLLRLSGIPARAVLGYRYVYPFEKADVYEVSGSCAHIWPEAYLRNVGWVPFEPTGAYRTAAEYTWHRRPAASARNDAQAAYLPPAPAPAQVPGALNGEGSVDDASAALSDETMEQAVSPVSRILRIALPTVISVLVMMVLLVLGTLAASMLRYLRAAPEKRLAMDVDMIKKGIRRQSAEDFADRGLLSDYIAKAPEALRPDIQRVFSAYYRVVYGNGAVSAEENELAARVREQLRLSHLKNAAPLNKR